MIRFRFILGLFCVFAIVSCQKEVDWSVVPTGGGSGSGGSGSGGSGGGSGSGSSNGDLCVRAVAITAGTTDTNTINLTWDANKRLIQYKSTGRTNGFDASAQYDITRLSNGNIQKIYSKPFIFFPGMSGVDSIVTYVYYQGTTSQFKYSIGTTYTSFMNIKDSTVFTYNTSGKISVKTVYQESILTGMMALSSKETYTYDAAGNVVAVNNSTADPITGVLSAAGSTSATYNTHKAPAPFGDEAFLILSPESTSVNCFITKIQNGLAGGGSTSTAITGTLSNAQYNSFDRPSSATVTTTPMPPGYVLNTTYYYQ